MYKQIFTPPIVPTDNIKEIVEHLKDEVLMNRSVEFQHVDLTKVDLTNKNLSGAILTGAKLNKTDLIRGLLRKRDEQVEI